MYFFSQGCMLVFVVFDLVLTFGATVVPPLLEALA